MLASPTGGGHRARPCLSTCSRNPIFTLGYPGGEGWVFGQESPAASWTPRWTKVVVVRNQRAGLSRPSAPVASTACGSGSGSRPRARGRHGPSTQSHLRGPAVCACACARPGGHASVYVYVCEAYSVRGAVYKPNMLVRLQRVGRGRRPPPGGQGAGEGALGRVSSGAPPCGEPDCGLQHGGCWSGFSFCGV